VRVGVFTPLLSQMSLEDVLKKLKGLNIDTVELGTGNYPGDAHCKLSMLEDKAALKDFKAKLADHGFSISALSCHGNPLHPDKDRAKHDQDVKWRELDDRTRDGVYDVVADNLDNRRKNGVTDLYKEQDAAKTLLRFLSSPAAQATWKAKGFEAP